MEKVAVGVIGTGVLGRHHVRLYKECPSAQLIGIYDKDPEVAIAVSSEFNVPAFSSTDDLLKATEALSVAVPTDLHFDCAERCLQQDKHILIEKPLASNATEGRRLVELAAERGRILHVGHVENFNPVTPYLRSKVSAPLFVEAHRLAPFPPARNGAHPRGTEVSVVHDLMIHDLDLILELVGSEVQRIEGVGMPVLSKFEDIANVRLLFENGCVANITASRISPECMRKIRVFEPSGYYSLDYNEQKGEIHTRSAEGISREPVPIASCNALEVQLSNFLGCVLELRKSGHSPACGVSGNRALRALELADRIVEEIRMHLQQHQHLAQMTV